MARLRERVVLPDAEYEISLDENGEYCLRYGNRVEYRNGTRRIGARTEPYRFRSVEQMRYDFERDVESA
jgi:hypothetical protein